MPAYRTIGGYDDQVLTDGDAGFTGMNQRLQPNQLQAGEIGRASCRERVLLLV
jgi:hypothetical protein